jgi:hypothetical protein
MIDQKLVETLEYFNYLGRTITNEVRCTLSINANTVMVIEAFNKKTPFVSKLSLNLMNKLVKFCILIKFLYGADT